MLLGNFRGAKEPITEVLQLTQDLEGLVKMIEDLYSDLQDRSAKNRYTKLKNKIIAHLKSTNISQTN